MSYPQPNADDYALNGYKFFRLNTPLISDGDIYESAQGAQGFAIGPDSDISKVNIAYFDDQVTNYVNQVAITPERAFPGFIAAQNDGKHYAPSGRPGKILMWSDELYNPTYAPDFGVDVGGRLDFVVPTLDVVQYFAPASASMNAGRNDKEYWYDFINAPVVGPGAAAAWALILPFYGRRFMSLTWYNASAQQNYFGIAGLHYRPGTATTAAVRTQLLVDTLIAGTTATTRLIKAGTNGTFDAVELRFTGTSATSLVSTDQSTLRILVSDREA